MKKLILGLLLCSTAGSLLAKDGYHINVTFKNPVPDNHVYLAHYYAKSFPTVYKVDSAAVTNNGTKAVFNSPDSILGGVYMLIYKNNSRTAEFLLDNGDAFDMTVDTSGLPKDISFSKSSINSDYQVYEVYLQKYGEQRQDLINQLKDAKTQADSQVIEEKGKKLSDELTAYRQDYINKHPKNFLSALLRPLIPVKTPDGPHYLADGKTIDSTFEYEYFKQHYWDNFDFTDNRLIFTPIYDARLNEYFNRVIYQLPDSVNAEADALLAKTKGAPELFKYSLYWLARNAQTSRVMGMDEVFVHLVENYYMKGEAFWLDSAQVAKFADRAQKIAPNVIGNPAPKLNLQDVWSLQNTPLDKVQSDYTVVIFWSPTCGHCKKEIPLLDSAYNAGLKQKGVKIYSIPVDGKLTDIQDFIKNDKITDWINVVDAQNNSDFRENYDVYSTPKIYLLDKNKKIIGKGLDHSNIMDVIEFNENKNKKKS